MIACNMLYTYNYVYTYIICIHIVDTALISLSHLSTSESFSTQVQLKQMEPMGPPLHPVPMLSAYKAGLKPVG